MLLSLCLSSVQLPNIASAKIAIELVWGRVRKG